MGFVIQGIVEGGVEQPALILEMFLVVTELPEQLVNISC